MPSFDVGLVVEVGSSGFGEMEVEFAIDWQVEMAWVFHSPRMISEMGQIAKHHSVDPEEEEAVEVGVT